jgi:uncharacterized membrane protein YdjX (TVP38/TMEM64 family)
MLHVPKLLYSVVLPTILMISWHPHIFLVFVVDAYNPLGQSITSQQQQHPMTCIRTHRRRNRQASLWKYPHSSHSFLLEKKRTFSSPNNHPSTFLSLRGGCLFATTISDNDNDAETSLTTNFHEQTNNNNENSLQQSTKSSKIRTILLSLAVGIPIAILAYQNRHQLFDKQYLQDKVLHTLQKLHSDQDPWRGILYYVLGMAFWEALGLSTIPVETAAGMALGSLPRSILASLTGKLLGATTAFCVGRYVLQRPVRKYLATNSQFQLLEQSVASQPLTTAMVMKYSCLPELFKNCGSSLLMPISLPTFVGVTLLHGGTFTCVWSWLGHDTALRLLDPQLPPNRALQITMAIVMTLGMLASPIVMAWFFRDLQQKQQQQQQAIGPISATLSEE